MMINLLFFTHAIWLIIATTQLHCSVAEHSEADEAWNQLFRDEPILDVMELGKLIITLNKDEFWRNRKLVEGYRVKDLTPNDDYSPYGCYSDNVFWLEERFEKVVDTPNLLKYLDHYRKVLLTRCGLTFITGAKIFEREQPYRWANFQDYYAAIKGNSLLYSELNDDNMHDMSQEMITALENVRKAKSPFTNQNFQEESLTTIGEICAKLENSVNPGSLGVVANLSPSIKMQGELPEYIRYLRFCRRAQKASATPTCIAQ